MQESVSLLISGGTVVTVDPAGRIISAGAVAVNADRIVAVGSAADLEAQYAPARRIDARGKLVLPGLVDTYHHAGHGLIKGIYRGRVGWPATPIYFHATTPDWWYAEGLLTALERIKFGVTTGVSIIGATPARADDPIFALRNAAAVSEAGTRALIGVGPPERFLGAHLPPWSGTFYDGEQAEERPFTYTQTLDVSREVISQVHGSADGRVQAMLAVPYLCGLDPAHMRGNHRGTYTPEAIRTMVDDGLELRAIADAHGVLIHTHGARGTLAWAARHFGAEALDALLGPDVLFAHANGLTPDDIALMQAHDCAAIAVPFATWNTYLGPCPLVELARNGVRAAIATDGAAPFHVSDLFLGMHRAMFLQWMEHEDFSVLPAGRALRMVTVEAAGLLGLADTIGSLEVGKKADIITIDLNQPHLTPCVDPLNMLAYYVRGNDVDTTIVDGVVLMENRRVLSLDEAEVLERAQREAAAAFERFDISPYLRTDHAFWHGAEEAQP